MKVKTIFVIEIIEVSQKNAGNKLSVSKKTNHF